MVTHLAGIRRHMANRQSKLPFYLKCLAPSNSTCTIAKLEQDKGAQIGEALAQPSANARTRWLLHFLSNCIFPCSVAVPSKQRTFLVTTVTIQGKIQYLVGVFFGPGLN